MTSFSPERARSCSFGIVTRTALSDCCTLMVASSPVEELAPPAHRVDALDEEVEVVRHVDEVQALAVHDERRRQGVAAHVAVELREEGIGRGVLEERRRPHLLRELAREARLAAADRTLDHDIAIFHEGTTSAAARPLPGITASGHTSSSG